MQHKRTLLIISRFIYGMAPDMATAEKDKICIKDHSLLDGYLVISGGVRCGSAEAPVERYYSPTQPPPVADLLCYVQCITGRAVGGGTQGHTHTHS